MPDLPTRLDYFNIGASEVLARSAARPPGQRVSPDEIFTEGSDINIVIASASAMADEVTRQLALRINALFLDGARGIDLDRLVADRFSPTIVRRQATPAVVDLVFTRSAGPLPPGTLDVGFQVKTPAGITFELIAPASFQFGSTGPVTAPAQALLAGLAGNVDANTITQFVAVPFDPNVQVTNPAVAAGGDTVESDARLRARAKSFYLIARRGTLAAIEFGALTVPGVRQATAVEELDSFGNQTGRVFLYIADANGQANAALSNAVRNALLEWRCAGITVDVIGAIPVYQAIVFRLQFQAGFDSTLVFAQVANAVVAAVNQNAPNVTLQVSLLSSVARSIPGTIVNQDAVQTPAGDVVPVAGQVIRTRLDLVTNAP